VAVASIGTDTPAKGTLGMRAWLGAMVGLTLLAGGVGGFLGLRMLPNEAVPTDVEAKAVVSAEPSYKNDTTLRELPPIITNLADPTDAWLRLQASIVFDKKAVEKPDVMSAEIASDLLGYMKSLTLMQIGGASGLQHLREDLSERAQIRSDGRVRELIIEALVIQ
jgi:flagellar FliL protein